ncbi:hypothetical protein ACN28S_03160 [Cystobacter fuscus]
MYLRAKVQDGAGPARSFELWREGERRLKRVDGDGLELRVEDEGRPGTPAYVFTVVDRRAGTLRRLPAERAGRLGPAFTWWPQAHLLSLPGPRYTLQRVPGPGARWGGARCEWYLFTPDGQPGTRVCWSREFAVPLRIDEQRGAEWWTRLSVDSIGPIPRRSGTGGWTRRGCGNWRFPNRTRTSEASRFAPSVWLEDDLPARPARGQMAKRELHLREREFPVHDDLE